MTSAPVVVGVLGDAGSRRALDWALDEARALGAPVHLVRARSVRDAGAGTSTRGGHPDDAVLAEAVARVGRRAAVTAETVDGSAARTLLRHSADAAVVVLGPPTHGPFGSVFLGSTAVLVASAARCPVVVVRPGEPGRRPTGGVVVGFDGTAAGRDVLEVAFQRAARTGEPLTVVHVWTVPDIGLGFTTPALERGVAWQAEQDRAYSESVVAEVGEAYPGVRVRHEVLHTDAARALTEASRTAECVVVGSRGRAELAGLVLGSVGQALLRHASCPVLVVPRPRAR